MRAQVAIKLNFGESEKLLAVIFKVTSFVIINANHLT